MKENVLLLRRVGRLLSQMIAARTVHGIASQKIYLSSDINMQNLCDKKIKRGTGSSMSIRMISLLGSMWVLWLLAGCALSDLGNLRGDGYQLIVNHRLFEPPSYLMLKYAGSVLARSKKRHRRRDRAPRSPGATDHKAAGQAYRAPRIALWPHSGPHAVPR